LKQAGQQFGIDAASVQEGKAAVVPFDPKAKAS
jgi:hypothetical protein